MRKIASNLLLKEHTEQVFFLCKQPDGYRIIKEIDGDEDCRIVEFEIDDENSDDNVNIEYYEYYDESDIPDDLEIEMEITTENSNENK